MKALFFVFAFLSLMAFSNYRFYQNIKAQSLYLLPLSFETELLHQKDLAKDAFKKRKNKQKIKIPTLTKKREQKELSDVENAHKELSKLDKNKKNKLFEDLFLIHYEGKIPQASRQNLLRCKKILFERDLFISFIIAPEEKIAVQNPFADEPHLDEIWAKMIKGNIDSPYYLPLRFWLGFEEKKGRIDILVNKKNLPQLIQVHKLALN